MNTGTYHRATKGLVCALLVFAAGCGTSVRVVERVPATGRNSFYVSNRAPLEPSGLMKLPIGAIKPRGWLLAMLEMERDGMVGHLPQLSKWCKAEGNAWLNPQGRGHSPWEELPYWLKGYGDLGYVLGDEQIISEARKWIEGILSSQEPDGWFGPRANKTALDGKPDMWPNMIALNCLQSYYEYSGDERVLELMSRYFRWQLSVPEEDFLTRSWQKRRAGDNLESVFWLYNRTGQKWLLELAEKIHRHTSNWTDGMASWHGVNIAQCFREPAEYYLLARDPKFVQATKRNYNTVMGLYGQVPGGMFGADENCRKGYYGPRQGSETCAMVEFMHSFEMLTKITSEPIWADRCEEVAFNSFPAAWTPDLKGIHYLTAPNMTQLDRFNKSPGLQNRGCMLAYSPWIYRCCQHNVSHGWPYFAEELWLATADNGLCASMYCASQVEARVGDGATVRIDEETNYPFDERIKFTVHTPRRVRFPLYLRIPKWCERAKIRINGKQVKGDFKALSYAVIDRRWRNGDTVELELPAEIRLKVWSKNGNCVSVYRGPLAFSLKIKEKWVAYEGRSGKAEEWVRCDAKSIEWPAFEVYPASAWNYGLLIDWSNPAGSFEMMRKTGALARQPFTPDSVPIELRAKAKRIPQWKMDDLNLVGKVPTSPVHSDEAVETVTLIPMGAARLRISAFPTIGEGK